MYAATHPYTVDENGNRKYVYCHWGVVDENKKFIPGKRYIFASLEERERLIFPDDWDMSEAKRLSGAKQPGRPAYTDADKNRFYGDIWLLEQVFLSHAEYKRRGKDGSVRTASRKAEG